MKRFVLFMALACALVFASSAIAEDVLKLATTTSTENTGLLDKLLPPFEKKYDIRVDILAVGTGKALKLGERGDVDVVMVHAPGAEKEFVSKGYGVNRREVMYNDFIIVGPERDPAKIKGSKNVVHALAAVAASESPFISRGDDSGTHKKEKALWKDVGIAPKGKWYMEVGQGMGQTLSMANEKRAYTLVDRGTYLAYKSKIDLPILCEGDKRLHNLYSIIAVDPARHKKSNYLGAMALIGWVTAREGQKVIGEFKISDKLLFHPLAIPQ